MNRALAAAAALALVALPAGAHAKPTKTDRSNAAKECRAERGGSDATREAFRARYGTNKSGRNAFGKCVSRRSRDEQSEGEAAAKNAAKECEAEREADPAAFAETYGSNANGRNAFGKCVSQKAREHEQDADAADAERSAARKAAAKDCAAERRELGREAFAERYGTNRNQRNAFGRCVSRGAREEA